MNEDVDERFRYKLRLFMSVDLIGSTAFKSRPAKDPREKVPQWAKVFTEFLNGFPLRLEQAYQHLPASLKTDERARIWKFVGDEILFQVELKRHEEALAHIVAMKRAALEYDDDLTRKELPLGVKCCGWVAGFPVANTEVSVPVADADGARVTDYLGPDVDLGFRIARYASDRMFPVSVKLAMLLVHARTTCKGVNDQVFYLHATGELKGILGGRRYPILYTPLKSTTEFAELEGKLLGVGPVQQGMDDVRQYLEAFVEQEPSLHLPFIAHPSETHFTGRPEGWDEARDKMRAEETNRGYADGEEGMDEIPQGKGAGTALPSPELRTKPARSTKKQAKFTSAKTPVKKPVKSKAKKEPLRSEKKNRQV